MKDFLRRRGPTAIAVALAFIAGGAGVTTAQSLITGADIKNGSIKNADLGKGAVNSPKIADGQVKTNDLGKGAVKSPKIADGQVKRADLINGGVNSAKIADNTVGSTDLANGGVGNADLANNAVNSTKIQDGQVATADLADNAVNSAKIIDGQVTSADIADGTIAIGDISGAAQDALTAYEGANWGVMDRNVVRNGDSYLRAGPTRAAEIPGNPAIVPPMGVGSLGVRTGAGTGDPSGGDKAAFGNEVDFAGDLVSALTAVSFFVYTTTENITPPNALNNVPSIAIEIDPNLESVPGDNFATMVYVPNPILTPTLWVQRNAVAEGLWGLSSLPPGTTCHIDGGLCTFAELITFLTADDATDLAPAVIGTVGVTKGRDAFTFSGAVDALQINGTVYDFEPNGVFETPAP